MEDFEISSKIGAQIREARLKKGMSQAFLADAAGISLPHVSLIENGKTKMQLLTFIRVVEALQVSADSILRLDVPEVKKLYQSEFSELLNDCTPAEMDSIMKIVRELKVTIQSNRKAIEE